MANTNYDGIYGSDQNTNIIDTRIVLRHDTLGNWNNSSIILDKGEIGLTGILKTGSTTDIDRFLVKVGDGKSSFSNLQWTGATPRKFDLNSTEVLVANELGVVEVNGTYLAKIGDGGTEFKSLKFLSGPASDVLAWAKQSQFPVYESGSGNTIVDIKYLHNGSTVISTANTTAADATGIVLYREDRVKSITNLNDGIIITPDPTDSTKLKIGHKTFDPVITGKDESNTNPYPTDKAAQVVTGQKYDEYGHVIETDFCNIAVSSEDETEIPDANISVFYDYHKYANRHQWNIRHNPADAASAKAATNKNNKKFITAVNIDPNGHVVDVNTADADVTGLKDAIDEAKKAGTDAQADINAMTNDGADLEILSGYGRSIVQFVTDNIQNNVQSLETRVSDNENTITAINDAETGILAQAKTDAANQSTVVLSEAQKYAEGKVNALAGNVYTKEQTYTQDEVDALISAAHSWGEF